MADTPDDKVNDAAPEGGEETSVAEEDEGGGFNAKKIILFVVVPLFLILGGGAGAYFTGMLDGMLGKEHLECEEVKEGDEQYDACVEELARQAASDLPGAFIDIPDLIVNLNTGARQPHFLKISMKVELEDPTMEAEFIKVQPRVIDQFQTYLRELRMEDLRGSSGLYRMKIELLNRVRAAAPSVKVRDVLFQEILVQ